MDVRQIIKGGADNCFIDRIYTLYVNKLYVEYTNTLLNTPLNSDNNGAGSHIIVFAAMKIPLYSIFNGMFHD